MTRNIVGLLPRSRDAFANTVRSRLPNGIGAGKPLALIGSAQARDSRNFVDRLDRPGIPDNDV